MWQALPQLIMMGQMKQADPALDIDALNRFRAEHKITDPVLAARAMNYDRDLAKAREVAEAQALDKARSEVAALAPAVPYAPYGPPHTLQIPEPGFKTIDESEIAALQDPEILRLWQPSAA
jgi:hypothetical protein